MISVRFIDFIDHNIGPFHLKALAEVYRCSVKISSPHFLLTYTAGVVLIRYNFTQAHHTERHNHDAIDNVNKNSDNMLDKGLSDATWIFGNAPG